MDAIIIVDLQKAFPVPPDVVRRIAERSRELPRRVFTKFLNEPDSLFCRKLRRSSCLPGTAERELLIEPSPGDIVLDKTGYGLTADQIEQLRNAGIRKALVCGVDTDACVLGVVFTLFDAGIDCEVDPALCWSSTGLQHEALTIVREQFGTG
jgi:nicotinamidase-related amidase